MTHIYSFLINDKEGAHAYWKAYWHAPCHVLNWPCWQCRKVFVKPLTDLVNFKEILGYNQATLLSINGESNVGEIEWQFFQQTLFSGDFLLGEQSLVKLILGGFVKLFQKLIYFFVLS
jgi:hypothetical protein